MHRRALSKRLRAKRKITNSHEQISIKWGSVSDIISAVSQLALLIFALWGLIFTDAGQKLISELRTDVSEARGSLNDLRNQRTILEERRVDLEKSLSDRQFQLDQASSLLLRTEMAASNAALERDQASSRLKVNEAELQKGREELSRLASTLEITVPTAKQVICSNISWSLNIPAAYLDLQGLIPKLRWNEFKRGKQKFSTWAQLQKEFEAWSKENTPSSDGIPAIIIKGADRTILSEINSQSHWESFGPGVARKQLGNMVKDDPNTLEFGINLYRVRPPGTLSSVERYNLWSQIEPIFKDNKLANLNSSYAEWLLRVQSMLNIYKKSFDVDLPKSIPEGIAYDRSIEDIAISYKRLLFDADKASEKLRTEHCNGQRM
jgi:hypothetical protein